MNLSLFVAQAVALLYLAIGLGMLVSSDYYKKLMNRLYDEMTALYIGGFLSLVTGFALVTYHNVWTGWPILVTVIGWMALIKGICILAFPKSFAAIGKFALKGNLTALGLIIIVLGLIFGYFGFLI